MRSVAVLLFISGVTTLASAHDIFLFLSNLVGILSGVCSYLALFQDQSAFIGIATARLSRSASIKSTL